MQARNGGRAPGRETEAIGPFGSVVRWLSFRPPVAVRASPVSGQVATHRYQRNEPGASRPVRGTLGPSCADCLVSPCVNRADRSNVITWAPRWRRKGGSNYVTIRGGPFDQANSVRRSLCACGRRGRVHVGTCADEGERHGHTRGQASQPPGPDQRFTHDAMALLQIDTGAAAVLNGGQQVCVLIGNGAPKSDVVQQTKQLRPDWSEWQATRFVGLASEDLCPGN